MIILGRQNPEGGFPEALVEKTRQWQFKLVRDETCDQPILEWVPAEDAETGRKIDMRLPLWKLLPGAEHEALPFGETPPCYSLRSGGCKPDSK